MDMTLDCIPCIIRQAVEAARMVTDQRNEQERVLRRVLLLLADTPYDKTPAHIATLVHTAVREELDAEDPYREVKDRSNRLAASMVRRLEGVVTDSADPFETALRFAIAGNIIDYGVEIDDQSIHAAISAALQQPLPASEVEELRDAIGSAKQILYLADNAGEVVFDRVLIERMPTGKITFVVRGGPVLNDATRVDAEAAGLQNLVEVVDNGSTAPGTILEFCSEDFRERFRRADLIIAKGQGNFESLSSESAPIFFLLKVKCPVVAHQLGCQVGDLVVRKAF